MLVLRGKVCSNLHAWCSHIRINPGEFTHDELVQTNVSPLGQVDQHASYQDETKMSSIAMP